MKRKMAAISFAALLCVARIALAEPTHIDDESMKPEEVRILEDEADTYQVATSAEAPLKGQAVDDSAPKLSEASEPGGAIAHDTEPSVNLYQPTTDGWINTVLLLGSGEVRTDEEKDKGYCVTPPIPIEGGKTYTISPRIATTSLEAKNRARTYAGDDTPLDVMQFTFHEDGSVTFTTPKDSTYIRFTVGKAEFTQNFDALVSEFNVKFMLVEGSEAPADYVLNSPPSAAARSVEPADGSVTAEMPAEDTKAAYSPLAGKAIANFGDSIFGNARSPHDISTMLAERTGATVYNCAFGGCRMGPHIGHWDAFSMYRLADAIAAGDYSLQEEALKFEDRTSYAQEPLALIKSIDFSELDILTIAYGTNDFTGSNPIDNAENPLDTSTVCGALRYSIEKLLAAYPQLHIFVLLPTWRFVMDSDGNFTEDSSTMTNSLGKTLPDYVQAIAETAKAYNLPVVDNYYELGINRFNRAQYFSGKDGVHQNEAGRARIAEHLAHELW